MSEPIEVVLAAYDAVHKRDADALVALVAPEMELLVPTGVIANGAQPYRGHEGIRRYFGDVARVWRELRLVPHRYGGADGSLVVIGRVYGLDVQGGLVDSPAGWLWRVRDSRIISARAFTSHEEAVAAAGLAESELRPLGRPAEREASAATYGARRRRSLDAGLPATV